MNQEKKKIPRKICRGIIQALRAGQSPDIGFSHIQVGRDNEIQSIYEDIQTVAEGGSAFRFIIADYGSGKTFFLKVIRQIAHRENLVTAYADLSSSIRFVDSKNQSSLLYAELMANLATKTQTQGNALSIIVENFLTSAKNEAKNNNQEVTSVINERLKKLSALPHGYTFAKVIKLYWQAYQNKNDVLRNHVLCWLRGEYKTKKEAQTDLGVAEIVSSENFYNILKLMGLFVRHAGYKGLFINIDEVGALYKIPHASSRNNNYCVILSIINSLLEGRSGADYLGFIFSSTPEILDGKKGIYSDPALHTRLEENKMAEKLGAVDFNTTILRLPALTKIDLENLFKKVVHIYAYGDPEKYLLNEDQLKKFLEYCSSEIKSFHYSKPREAVKELMNLLSILEQNKNITLESAISELQAENKQQTNSKLSEQHDLADFKI